MTAGDVQVRRLRERLLADAASSGVPTEQVNEALDNALTAFDRAAIREFVPVLVERRVREALGLRTGSSITRRHGYGPGQA